MISNEDIQHLANLARIEIKDEETDSIRSKMEGVLAYVSEVQEIVDTSDNFSELPSLRNVFREDSIPHDAGIYTDATIKNAPESEGGYIKVRKILP